MISWNGPVDFPDEMAREALVTLRKGLRKARAARSDLKDSAILPAAIRETTPEHIEMPERCWRRLERA